MERPEQTINPLAIVRRQVRELKAYRVDQTPCPAQLDANESPYVLPEKLMGKAWAVMAGAPLNRYPDLETSALKRAIARKESVREDEILPGNGSDELVQTLMISCCRPGSCAFVPSPSFSMYSVIAHYLGLEVASAPLRDNWRLDLEKTVAMIREKRPSAVFLASPNNPTGVQYTTEEVEAVADASDGLVVVDEAYVDYADKPVGPLFTKRPNVVIMRTLSKTGLAALRIGYTLADASLTEQINKVRLPFNINSITQGVAALVVENWKDIQPYFAITIKERERVFAELNLLGDVTAYPSQANFILARIGKDPAGVYDALLEKGVRVRWFRGAERLGDCFRITIGTPDENNLLLESLRALL